MLNFRKRFCSFTENILLLFTEHLLITLVQYGWPWWRSLSVGEDAKLIKIKVQNICTLPYFPKIFTPLWPYVLHPWFKSLAFQLKYTERSFGHVRSMTRGEEKKKHFHIFLTNLGQEEQNTSTVGSSRWKEAENQLSHKVLLSQ